MQPSQAFASGIRGGFWQRAAFALFFALMAGAGYGAYAGYGRIVRSPAGTVTEGTARPNLAPPLWVRSPHPVSDPRAPAEMSAWLSKVGNLGELAAIIVFGEMAATVASEL